MKKIICGIAFILSCFVSWAQPLAPTPPMGFMTWNYFKDDISEEKIKSLADAMEAKGLVALGYDHIFIDDCWQGGRDHKNNIIPDPIKFPSGMKALADYLHAKHMKLGIYSDAAPLTCAGFTASLHFEKQDAKTFASWGIDYLKYDYCNAPVDAETAKARYQTMSKALKNSGRDIVFSVCEWGNRKPWLWANKAGGQLWRTTADIRDKWKATSPYNAPDDLHQIGAGILDIVNVNAALDAYAKPGAWNDPDMLVIGLKGRKGPSGELGGTGCTDIEYQSQMSLWCIMSAPLMITCDIRNMDPATTQILSNKDILAIDQDTLGKQAKRIQNDEKWQVFLKPLAQNEKAIAILNQSDQTQSYLLHLDDLGISNAKTLFNVWSKKSIKAQKTIKLTLKAHETLVFRIK